MSKGSPQSLVAEISQRCHLYPGDKDAIRLSASRLESFLVKRDGAMLVEVRAMRKELSEQKQLIKVIQKYAKRGGYINTDKEKLK